MTVGSRYAQPKSDVEAACMLAAAFAIHRPSKLKQETIPQPVVTPRDARNTTLVLMWPGEDPRLNVHILCGVVLHV